MYRILGLWIGCTLCLSMSRQLLRRSTIDGAESANIARDRQSMEVPSRFFLNGCLLEELAGSHVKVFSELLPSSRPLAPTGVRSWCSLSRADGVHFAMDALETAYDRQGVSLSMTKAFTCEPCDDRRAWVREIDAGKNVGNIMGACIYKDTNFNEAFAECWVHKKKCVVPACDFVFVRLCCKELAALNTSKAKSVLGSAGEKKIHP
jgi:hypothetical protein